MLQLKIWFVIKQSPNFELKNWLLGLKECENSHTLTTTTTGSKNSQRQSEQCSVPPKAPFFTDSWSWMKSSARHT